MNEAAGTPHCRAGRVRGLRRMRGARAAEGNGSRQRHVDTFHFQEGPSDAGVISPVLPGPEVGRHVTYRRPTMSMTGHRYSAEQHQHTPMVMAVVVLHVEGGGREPATRRLVVSPSASHPARAMCPRQSERWCASCGTARMAPRPARQSSQPTCRTGKGLVAANGDRRAH